MRFHEACGPKHAPHVLMTIIISQWYLHLLIQSLAPIDTSVHPTMDGLMYGPLNPFTSHLWPTISTVFRLTYTHPHTLLVIRPFLASGLPSAQPCWWTLTFRPLTPFMTFSIYRSPYACVSCKALSRYITRGAPFWVFNQVSTTPVPLLWFQCKPQACLRWRCYDLQISLAGGILWILEIILLSILVLLSYHTNISCIWVPH